MDINKTKSHNSRRRLYTSRNQNTQGVKNERFLISTRQNNVRIFGIQTDKKIYIKHEKEKKLSWMSLLKIAVEKPPPSQRSSLEISDIQLRVFSHTDTHARAHTTHAHTLHHTTHTHTQYTHTQHTHTSHTQHTHTLHYTHYTTHTHTHTTLHTHMAHTHNTLWHYTTHTDTTTHTHNTHTHTLAHTIYIQTPQHTTYTHTLSRSLSLSLSLSLSHSKSQTTRC